jgi:aminopeptidase N
LARLANDGIPKTAANFAELDMPSRIGASAITVLCALLVSASPRADNRRATADIDVLRYDLALSADIPTSTVEGLETITFRAVGGPIGLLAFSNNALTITSARVDERPVGIVRREEQLAFVLPTSLASGRTAKLEIAFTGRPARGLVSAGGSLYSSYFACDWMICRQDRFGDKAWFNLDLRVPTGLTSLSAGRLTSRRSAEPGFEIHHWQSPRPYSAYLYGFAMGRFNQHSVALGKSRLTYLSAFASADDLARQFSPTPAVVAFLAQKAGMDLPVSEYTQLLVKGSEAQEAATWSVLGGDVLPKRDDDPSQDWAIVHELSHQWWGNLITANALQDFWLNEGFATFMTAAWKEHRYGRAAYDAELNLARKRLARAGDAGFDKPLAWDGKYPSLAVRRAVHYSKGALFLDRLRSALGDTAFWAGIRLYTHRNAGKSVTSIDFQRAMEAASGRNLQPLFDEWVYSLSPA